MQNFWWMAIIILAGLGFLAAQFAKTGFGKKMISDILLRFPAVSGIVTDINSAYTTRNLSSLIGAGVSLPRALEITADTVGNLNYRLALNNIKERVKKGEKFSDAIKDYRRFYPATMIQMIAVGEETGETSNILQKLAEFYENEVDEATKNFTAVIEPMLMIIIGVVVGFFAVSMIQPMYSMMDAV
jgi:type IV pilus assembly protein PilC